MTSMPASRSARATTFAPRSWPSRPGLATTTRMRPPRARLALRALADARLPHLSVADAPTTGGVWISVTAAADLRVAVTEATVAFAGPRVVEAFTGTLPPAGSHTAESAYDAGLVDAL